MFSFATEKHSATSHQFRSQCFLADDRCCLGYLVAREIGCNLSGSPAKYAAIYILYIIYTIYTINTIYYILYIYISCILYLVAGETGGNLLGSQVPQLTWLLYTYIAIYSLYTRGSGNLTICQGVQPTCF